MMTMTTKMTTRMCGVSDKGPLRAGFFMGV